MFRQVYQVPNIFLRHGNGTWLSYALEFDQELFPIFIDHQMQRINNRVYDLSKTLSYLYANPTTSADREYLEKVISMIHQQQSNFYDPRLKKDHRSYLSRFDEQQRSESTQRRSVLSPRLDESGPSCLRFDQPSK